MTLEQITLIDLDDFTALRFTCDRCRAVLTLQLNETIQVPEICPACRTPWETERHGPIDDLVRGLKGLAGGRAGKFTVRLEVRPNATATRP